MVYAALVSAQHKPVFKNLRYEDDFSYLAGDTNGNWYTKMKFQPLSKDKKTYVSFGGDIRYQCFNIQNEQWGDVPKDNDGYLFSRMLLHADFRREKNFRAFVQLQSSMVNGKPVTSPLDEDPLEVHQAFAEVSSGNKILSFRLGRQEFSYGSQRLISVREGPNNRQSFDAAKIIFSKKNFLLETFFSHFVKAKKGLFNDGFNKDTKFWGAYLVKNKVPVFKNIDLYYFGLRKRQVSFDDGSGREIRHSIGSRLWGGGARFKYDMEAVYQLGKFGTKNIRAWTASMNAAYKLTGVPTHPEFGLKAEFISGDAHYADDKLQTFNPLFPRGGYFGLASIIGPANLADIHPSLAFQLTKKITLETDYDIFWRYSKNDGIYTPGVSLIYTGKNNPYNAIGQQLTVDLIYTPNPFLYFRGEFTWFDSGKYLKAAGSGKDIVFWGITSQVRF